MKPRNTQNKSFESSESGRPNRNIPDSYRKYSDLFQQNKDLYKPVIKNFERRPIISNDKNDIWSCDLVDMTGNIQGSQRGYILNCVDIFTRKAYSRVIPNKSEIAITQAFKSIFEEEGVKPRKIHADQESGFIHNKYLKQQDVQVYHTLNNPVGAPHAERFNKTMKEQMQQYRDANKKRWKEFVRPWVNQYNETTHRSIGMTPNEANNNILRTEMKNYENETRERKEPKTQLKVGDYVLIPRQKTTFEKGYTQRWNSTVYKITEVINSNPTTYKLGGLKGVYYKQELQKTNRVFNNNLV